MGVVKEQVFFADHVTVHVYNRIPIPTTTVYQTKTKRIATPFYQQVAP